MRTGLLSAVTAATLGLGAAACDTEADSPLVEDPGTVETPTEEGTTDEPTDESTEEETDGGEDGGSGEGGGNSGPG
jgi:hypothetical protein